MWTSKDYLLGAVAIAGFVASVNFMDFADTFAKPYHLAYVLDLIIIAWFIAGVKCSSITEPRQKRKVNLLIGGLFLLCLSVVLREEYHLINKAQNLEEAKNWVITTDYSDENVPQEKWPALIASERVWKEHAIAIAQQELVVAKTRDPASYDFPLTLSIFSGVLILYSLVTLKRSIAIDLEEANMREEAILAKEKLSEASARVQPAENWVMAASDSEHSNREKLMDELFEDLESLRMPESPEAPDTDSKDDHSK